MSEMSADDAGPCMYVWYGLCTEWAVEKLHNKLSLLVAGPRSPPSPADDGERELRGPHPCPLVSYHLPEHTILFARRLFTTAMSSIAPLPLAHLKRLTAFINARDGSQPVKELLPLMRAALSSGRASPPSETIISENIRAVQKRVKHRHERQRLREEAEAASAAAVAQAVSTRARQRSAAPASTSRAPASRQPKKVKQGESTAQIREEERLVAALAALRQRNVQFTAERAEAAKAARKAKADALSAERKQKKQQEVDEARAKRETLEQQRAEEQKLKVKIRDERALQSLTAAAKKHEYEQEQHEAMERAKRLDAKLEKVLDNVLEEQEQRRGQKRAREELSDESQENKENVEPQSEWQR